MSRMTGFIFCKNPAGNSAEANGRPFTEVDVDLTGVEAVTPAAVSKNGRALVDIDFHDVEILQELAAAGVTIACDKSNWIKIPVITSMEIMGQQLSDPDPLNITGCNLPATGPLTTDTCNIVDTLRVSCRIQEPYFTTPASAIGQTYSYGAANSGTGSCTEICHSADPNLCSPLNP
jgi:hypothetical protein